MKKDLYRLLGVPRKARAKEIEKAYLKLARRIHPDVNPGDRQAAARFREIQEAFRVLSNAKSRSLYDRTGETEASPEGEGRPADRRLRAGEHRTWEHLLREVFQDGEILEPEAGAVRGEDIHHVVEISFLEALKGTTAEVGYQREVLCDACGGRRFSPGARILPCPDCEGTGLIAVQRGPYTARKICPRCSGEGETGSEPCPACAGKGRRTAPEKVRVRVEAGSDSGTKITLPGGGSPGRKGGGPGDLVLTVKVQPHPDLERRGYNLYGSVPVTVAEAALGATILVPTAERKVHLSVPAGTQGGQQFRLEGRGVPLPGGKRRGDLFIIVNVVVPAAESAAARKLFQEIEKLFPENPRVRA